MRLPPDEPRASKLRIKPTRSATGFSSAKPRAPKSPNSSPSVKRRITGRARGASAIRIRAISRMAAMPAPSSLAPGPAGTESWWQASTMAGRSGCEEGSSASTLWARTRVLDHRPAPVTQREFTSGRRPRFSSCSTSRARTASLAADPSGCGVSSPKRLSNLSHARPAEKSSRGASTPRAGGG